MNAWFIVGYSLFFAVFVTGLVFLVSYYIYNSNRLFTKPKLSIWVVVIISFVICCFIGFLSWSIYNYVTSSESSYIIHIILNSILLAIYAGLLTAYLVLTLNIFKVKYDIVNFHEINWQEQINKVNKKYDVEALKAKIKKNHSKYYVEMQKYFSDILNKQTNANIKQSDKLADIVCFNELFAHKWSKKLNVYQEILTYEYMQNFKKN